MCRCVGKVVPKLPPRLEDLSRRKQRDAPHAGGPMYGVVPATSPASELLVLVFCMNALVSNFPSVCVFRQREKWAGGLEMAGLAEFQVCWSRRAFFFFSLLFCLSRAAHVAYPSQLREVLLCSIAVSLLMFLEHRTARVATKRYERHVATHTEQQSVLQERYRRRVQLPGMSVCCTCLRDDEAQN